MMASNVLSRLIPGSSPSIYEAIRGEEETESLDLEQGGGGIVLDQDNLEENALDLDPDQLARVEGRIRLETSGPAQVRGIDPSLWLSQESGSVSIS